MNNDLQRPAGRSPHCHACHVAVFPNRASDEVYSHNIDISIPTDHAQYDPARPVRNAREASFIQHVDAGLLRVAKVKMRRLHLLISFDIPASPCRDSAVNECSDIIMEARISTEKDKVPTSSFKQSPTTR